ncbi:hypothetical protein D9M68_599230 [compost metagenome]
MQIERKTLGFKQRCPLPVLLQGEIAKSNPLAEVAIGLPGTGQGQEGLHQIMHFGGRPGDSPNLSSLARRQMPSFAKELTGGADHHQRCAQFVADVAGEQALALQGMAQLSQCFVKGCGQVADFIGGIVWC